MDNDGAAGTTALPTETPNVTGIPGADDETIYDFESLFEGTPAEYQITPGAKSVSPRPNIGHIEVRDVGLQDAVSSIDGADKAVELGADAIVDEKIEGLSNYDWQGTDLPPRNITDNREPAHAATVEKGRVDTGDSSEWEQTGEAKAINPLTKKNTDSPESVLMGSAATTVQDPAQNMTPRSHGAVGYGHTQQFLHRGISSEGLSGASDGAQMPLQQNFIPDLNTIGSEFANFNQLNSEWDLRGGSGGVGFPEPDFRSSHFSMGNRFAKDPHLDMQGELDPRMGRPRELQIYRMSSDMSQQVFRERAVTPRRHGSAEIYDHSYDLGSGRGESSQQDSVFDQGMGLGSLNQGDVYRMGVGNHGMSHPMAASRGYYSQQMGAATDGMHNVNGSRKRLRDSYAMPGELPEGRTSQARHLRKPTTSHPNPPCPEGSSTVESLAIEPGSRAQDLSPGPLRQPMLRQPMSRPAKQNHEDMLISTLKHYITLMDESTKGTVKDSLYRISRNTNARVSGEPLQSRVNSRSSIVDRLVANLMYNRCDAHSRNPMGFGSGPAYPPQMLLSRMPSSPGIQLDPQNTMRLDHSPNI